MKADNGRGITRGQRLVMTSVVALLVAACATGPAPASSPTPSPGIAATTAPTLSAAPPTPSPVPTRAAAPTLTPDDVKISAFIKDGYAKWLSIGSGLSADAEVPEMISLTKDLYTLVKAQLALSSVYIPSPCTEPALRLYMTAMKEAQASLESMLGWAQEGMVGEVPADADISQAVHDLSASVTSLQASLC